jgi:hypothetical protein
VAQPTVTSAIRLPGAQPSQRTPVEQDRLMHAVHGVGADAATLTGQRRPAITPVM